MSFNKPDWVEARDYQQSAVESWLANSGCGIFHMATGTGKTVTALLAASEVAQRSQNSLAIVVAVPYQHLVDQWSSDLKDFGANPVMAYQSRKDWQPRLEREILEVNTGARDTCVVVTTHRTLSMEAARQTIGRIRGDTIFIADEVHHLGSEHQQNALMDDFDLRLGLSATPERWYDDDGTSTLHEYFGGVVFDYGLEKAIEADALCEYYYVPHIVELQHDEMEAYLALTSKIGHLMANQGSDQGKFDIDGNDALQAALFKRARLVGTAREKIDLLVDLLNEQSELAHTLVYCSDGSTGVDSKGRRHVDAVTDRLRSEFDVSVERFTAREGQAKRQELLNGFENGEIEILTSIKCLDEGVDVPATKRAHILASTSNPRQYVQRRGRILRTHKGKSNAVIHDYITVPNTDSHPEMLADDQYGAERGLIRKELERVSTFADAALNHPDAKISDVPTSSGSLLDIRRRYDLLSV